MPNQRSLGKISHAPAPAAKPKRSMANATLGVQTSASLAVHMIGQGLAHSRLSGGQRPAEIDVIKHQHMYL